MKKILWMAILLPMTVSAENVWESLYKPDPMTDAPRAIVSAVIDSKAVAVRCGFDSDGIDIVFMWQDYFSDDDTMITWRFDKEVAKSAAVSIASSNSSFFITDYYESNFLKSMMSSTKLVVQASPYNEGMETLVISLVGFTAAYNEHCGGIAPRTHNE